MNMKRATKACLFIAFSILGVMALLNWVMFGDRSSYQPGLSSYVGLPNQASDINVYKNQNISGLLIVDFSIKERDFIPFADEKGWKLKSIEKPESLFYAAAFHEGRANDKKEIRDGLYYS